jgi:hypothetical protein
MPFRCLDIYPAEFISLIKSKALEGIIILKELVHQVPESSSSANVLCQEPEEEQDH